jgi:hypothetical protein
MDGAPVIIHHEGTKGTKVHEAPPTTHYKCGVGDLVSFVPFVPSW